MLSTQCFSPVLSVAWSFLRRIIVLGLRESGFEGVWVSLDLTELSSYQVPRSLSVVRMRPRSDSIFVSAASSVTCYTCHSTESWEDCDQHLKQLNCSNAEVTLEFCLKYIKELRRPDGRQVSNYVRSCGESYQCSGKECGCKMSCCNTDYCNAAWAVLKASGILVVVCAALQLLL